MFVIGVGWIESRLTGGMAAEQSERGNIREQRHLDRFEPAQIMPAGGEKQPAMQVFGHTLRNDRRDQRRGVAEIIQN